MVRLLARAAAVALAALFGLCAGCVGSAVRDIIPQPSKYPFLAEYYPLPHHVPEHEGGVSLRFAMVHDVIHERFPKHGPAHYRERNRLTRERLAKLSPDDPAAFPLLDDLGAGLDRLGKPGEAAAILRDKLARQEAAGLGGRDLYTSYANLGTFIGHESLPKALKGDAAARERFREGLALVRKSVEVNPAAHFGRERWQVVVGEFLLAATEKPELLKTFDFLGNRLDVGIEQILRERMNGYGRPGNDAFNRGEILYAVPAFFDPGASPDDPARWAEFRPVREWITKVGAEHGWDKVAIPSHRKPVPFDEPTLGIIGIWRQGSGANPHFALALGETMLRVGQRYIAWTAFERASRLAGRFSPDSATQQFLRDHCRKRQREIEETLTFPGRPAPFRPVWQHVSPPPTPEAVADLRPAFEAELAHGEGYQRAYQEYEAKRITAGVPITDAPFFDEFYAGREPIASPVGPEDRFAFVPWKKMSEYKARRGWAWGVFLAGLAAMAMALLFRWEDRRDGMKEASQCVDTPRSPPPNTEDWVTPAAP